MHKLLWCLMNDRTRSAKRSREARTGARWISRDSGDDPSVVGQSFWRAQIKSKAVILIGLCCLIVCQRLWTFNQPIDSDCASYALIANELLHGKHLYTDVWDHKPPGIHVTYAAIVAPFGCTPTAIFVLGVSAAITTMFGLYRLSKALTKSEAAGLWSAAFWSALASDLALQANQPNAECFMNASLVWGLYFATVRRPWTAGILFFYATTLKQFAILVPLFVCWRSLAVIAGGWALLCAWFAGRWHDFWGAVFVYNRVYAGPMFEVLIAKLHWRYFVPNVLNCASFAIPLACVGFLKKNWTLIAYSIAGVLMTLPGQMVQTPAHYYQLLLPPIALAAGLGVHNLNTLGHKP
jgi:hypothetical protein